VSSKSTAGSRSLPVARWIGPAIGCLAVFGVSSVRFALTPSLPRGVYLALPPRIPLRRGDIVSFCPAPGVGEILRARHLVAPGSCPGGSVPLAKRIVALGPFACASETGLRLDGDLLAWPAFPRTLSLPRYSAYGPTPKDCVFATGDTVDSIDSRVFGCVSPSQVRDRLVPLLTERAERAGPPAKRGGR
jgi:type IV secretory pathway protease TraF